MASFPAMKTQAKVALLLVAAGAAVGGYYLWKRRSAGDGSATARVPAALQRVGVAGGGEGQRAITDPDPAGDLVLEGQVIDAAEKPVAGAVVRIDSVPERQTTSDAGGSFAFDALIGRDYTLVAEAGDAQAGPVRVRLAGTTEPVILRLVPGGALEVRVRSSEGAAPIAGATVELREVGSRSATTDAQGLARFSAIGHAWPVLWVSAPGHAPHARLIETSGVPGATDRQLVELTRGAPVAGRVLDPAGKPIAGARVLADPVAEPFPVFDHDRDAVTSDDQGNWRIPALAAGTYRFIAHHAGFAQTATAPTALDGQNPRTGIDIRMEPGASVAGIVRDAAGQPVAAALVRVVTTAGTVSWRLQREAYSDADGRFRIGGLARLPASALAIHDLGSSPIVALDLAARPEQEIELQLSIAGTLAGTVVTGGGEPVPEAQVLAEPEWTGAVDERPTWRVRGALMLIADAGGAFKFTGVPPGRYRLRAAHPGAPYSALELHPGQPAEAGATGVKVVLPAEGTITGRVSYADGSAPELFTVSVGGSTPVPFAGDGGKFSLRGPGGKQNLNVEGPGFAPKLVPAVAIPEGGKVDVGTVTVEKGRSVAGRVVDADGVPVGGAIVAAGLLLSGGGAEVHIPSESIAAQQTTTDERGEFLMRGFGDHPLVVVAEHPQKGRAPSVAIPRHLVSARVELVLQATGGLDGKVTRAGQPLPGTVMIANPRGATRSNFFVISGPDGTFSFDKLSAGPYLVMAMIGSGGGRPKDMHLRAVDVVAGARGRADIEVPVGTGSLGISAVADDGSPVMAASVALLSMVVDAPNMEVLREMGVPEGLESGSMYVRMAMGGRPAMFEALQPGRYSTCVVPIPADPNDPQSMQRIGPMMERLPMECQPVDVTAAAGQSAAVTVPAAWTKPPQ